MGGVRAVGGESHAYPAFRRTSPSYDIEAARRLYRECRATLSGTFNSAFLDQAESKEEEDFYVAVSTFFLQKRQQELIEQGVF